MLLEHKKRATISKKTIIRGIGLHSGQPVRMEMYPAPAGSGICFQNWDSGEIVRASLENVVDTAMAVTLGSNNWRIQTVEHILAALATEGITDILIRLDGEEIPIMDGSSQPFIEAIQEARREELAEDLEPIIIRHPIWVVDGDKYLVVLPANEGRISYTIDFDHPAIGAQTMTIALKNREVKQEVLAARTFGFLDEVEKLHEQGLALGGSADNAIIFTEDGILNPELRYQNECIRHKVLDFIGDLSLVGRPIQGHFLASKGGHALDIALARNIAMVAQYDEIQARRDKSQEPAPAGAASFPPAHLLKAIR